MKRILLLLSLAILTSPVFAQNTTTSTSELITNSTGLENAEIRIDGRVVSKAELDALDPEEIASVVISKSSTLERRVTQVTRDGEEIVESEETKDIIDVTTKKNIKKVEDNRPDFTGTVETKAVKVVSREGKIELSGTGSDTEYYLDGRRISVSDLNRVSTKDIGSIEVTSSSFLSDRDDTPSTITRVQIYTKAGRLFYWW